MSWEHAMAKELNKNRNRDDPAWFSGIVVSAAPLIVSAYDGQIMLDSSRLRVLRTGETLEAGHTVALLGNPFGGAPGSGKILVLGVVEHAV